LLEFNFTLIIIIIYNIPIWDKMTHDQM